jgi:NAD(P)-dependent dehydrogenase (short-subunit alcohol dehydrogenase family)
MQNLKPINEQVVVVFGASSGIGRATALSFAERGAKVIAAARGEDGLKSLIEEITANGGEADYVVADAADFASVNNVAEIASTLHGRIDTWVHLAAVSLYATFEETTPDEFKQIVDVNLTGQAYGAMAALPHLKREGRGALIHVSSVEARQALPYQSAYAASKHGIKGFLSALRIELQHEDIPISVTEIKPSGINTPFFNKARTKLDVKPMPVHPIYQPQIVADAILYAAENSVPEITVGGAGRAIEVASNIAPRIADAVIGRIAFDGQKTDEFKSENAADNLYHPLRGFNKVEGDFSEHARTKSSYTWAATHPVITRLIAGVAVGAAASLLLRAAINGNKNAPTQNSESVLTAQQ